MRLSLTMMPITLVPNNWIFHLFIAEAHPLRLRKGCMGHKDRFTRRYVLGMKPVLQQSGVTGSGWDGCTTA